MQQGDGRESRMCEVGEFLTSEWQHGIWLFLYVNQADL